MSYPIISIVIATFNSEKTLKNTLDSILYQTYPKTKIEILIIDGNSTDNTISIAKKYHCRIIPNPKVELVFAKQIGFLKAKGNYLIFLDSDEILENKNSLKQKYEIFQSNKNVKAVMLGGYKTNPKTNAINYYINEFGDPFSFFVYRESKSDIRLVRDWEKKYKKILISNKKNGLVFNFSLNTQLPLIELWAGGSMIDLTYCRKQFPNIRKNPGILAHLFYLITEQKKLTGMSKHDYTIHTPTDSLSRYLKKLSSRIKNNIFMTNMGVGGFSGRDPLAGSQFKIKSYLFIPYSLLLVFPFIDSLYLSVKRKNRIYLLHTYLCLYTGSLILYYYLLKSLGIKPKIKTYGN